LLQGTPEHPAIDRTRRFRRTAAGLAALPSEGSGAARPSPGGLSRCGPVIPVRGACFFPASRQRRTIDHRCRQQGPARRL